MKLILLGHIIGDFYVQTDSLAEEKQKSNVYMLIHCLLYTVVLGICFYILNRKLCKTLNISVFVCISHFMIDWIKRECDKKFVKREYAIFLIDQLVHVIILCFMVYIVGNHFNLQMDENLMINGLNAKYYMMAVIGILVCWKPAAIFVALVFKMIPTTIKQADQEADEMAEMEGIKIGSWIGVLEREIILILGLMGQFSAIGFVLAAKSLARFRQLENKAFAEKYLVGTLLSALIAIGCIALCRMI